MNFKVGDFVYLNEQSGIGVVLGLEPDEDSAWGPRKPVA
jgi:hypothetical protein